MSRSNRLRDMFSKFFLRHSLCLQPRPGLNLAPPGRGTNAFRPVSVVPLSRSLPIDIDRLSYVLPFLYLHYFRIYFTRFYFYLF